MQFRTSQDEALASTRGLLALFALTVVLLVVVLNLVLALLWSLVDASLSGWRGPFSGHYPPLFFETNTALVLLFVLGGTLVEALRLKAGGGRHVAQLVGGREVLDPPRDLQDKRLRNVADEMAIASGQPRPPVFVLDREDAINAFAAGWSADEAVVAVTRGAIERLSRDELQGLVAHEFGHIRNRDLRLNMILLSMVWGLSLVHGYGRSLVDPDEDGNRSGPSVLIGLAFLVVGWAGWLAGQALQASVSRQREYLADACAVQHSRSREGIGRALRKAWHQVEHGGAGMRDGRTRTMASLFFSAPPGWLAIHPPMRLRVKRIYGRSVASLPSERMRISATDDVAPVAFRSTGAGPVGRMSATGELGSKALKSEPAFSGPVDDAETLVMERSGSGPGRPSLRPAVFGAASAPLPRMEIRASAFGGLGEDRDAMGRLELLHGPMERRAALLALLMKPLPEGPTLPGRGADQLAAWRRETAQLSTADRVLGDVRALTMATRLPWFERLLARTAAASPSEHAVLLDAANRLVCAGAGPDALERLYLEGMRRRLSGMPGSLRPAGADSEFATELSELDSTSVRSIAVVSAVLNELVPENWHWYGAVMLEWDERGGALPLTRPDEASLVAAFDVLRTLPWMLRPLVIRLWVGAARERDVPSRWPREFLDGLRLCSLVLDSPLHRDVASVWTELDFLRQAMGR